jgi:hypothetical protein
MMCASGVPPASLLTTLFCETRAQFVQSWSQLASELELPNVHAGVLIAAAFAAKRAFLIR